MGRNRSKPRKFFAQPRIPGGRIGTHSALLPEIRLRIDALAMKHKVSRSWVAATLLADALGIGDQPNYKKAGA